MADLSGRVTISRAEHADLLRRAGDAEERAASGAAVSRDLRDALAAAQRERDEMANAIAAIAARIRAASGCAPMTPLAEHVEALIAARDAAVERADAAQADLRWERERHDVTRADVGVVQNISHGLRMRARAAEAERDEAHDSLARVRAALGAHIGDPDDPEDLTADVERLRVAFDLRLSLVHTVNRDVAEARGALRALRRSIWSQTLTVPRLALDECDAVLGRWDAAEAHSPASRAIGLGSSVRVLAVPDGAHSVRVGDVGEVIDLDPEAPEGTLYEVARRQQSGGWLAWWYRADQIERVDAAPPTTMEDALRTHAEADGDTTVWPSFTRIGDEDDGSPA